MANIIRIPANSQVYLTARRNTAQDKFNVIEYVYPYENAEAFPPAWAYWKCEETSGNRADATGNGNAWNEINDEVVDMLGKLGSAAVLFTGTSGITENLATATSYTFDLTGNFTIVFWIYVNRTGSGSADLYGSYGAGTYDVSSWITLGNGASVASVNFDCGKQPSGSLYVTANISLDAWHMVCLYYDGTGLHLEIDNTEIDSDLGTTRNLLDNGKVDWGGVWPYNIMGVGFDGHGVWLQALTPAQRSQLWNNGAGWSPY